MYPLLMILQIIRPAKRLPADPTEDRRIVGIFVTQPVFLRRKACGPVAAAHVRRLFRHMASFDAAEEAFEVLSVVLVYVAGAGEEDSRGTPGEGTAQRSDRGLGPWLC